MGEGEEGSLVRTPCRAVSAPVLLNGLLYRRKAEQSDCRAESVDNGSVERERRRDAGRYRERSRGKGERLLPNDESNTTIKQIEHTWGSAT